MFARLVFGAEPTGDAGVTAVDYSVLASVLDEIGSEVISPDVAAAASRFSLAKTLADLGIPDRVLLRELIPTRPIGDLASLNYAVALFYEDLGVALFLSGPLTPVTGGGKVLHCFPPSTPGEIRVFTHSPTDGTALEDLLSTFVVPVGYSFDEFVRQGVFIDVEGATGVSVDEFYQIYKAPTSRCLESPVEIWPME